MGQKSDFWEVCLSSSAIFYLSPFPEVASEHAAAKAAPGEAPTSAVQDTPTCQRPLGAPVCVGSCMCSTQCVPGLSYTLLKEDQKSVIWWWKQILSYTELEQEKNFIGVWGL